MHLSSTLLLATTAAIAAAPSVLAQDAKPPLRIVVLPRVGEEVRANLSRDAARQLTTALVKAGRTVVDAEQAEAIAARRRDRLAPAPDEEVAGDAAAAVGIARNALGDLLVRVSVEVRRERIQQGQYRVQNRVHLQVVVAADPTIQLDTTVDGTGRSFDGFAEAHDRALSEALGEGLMARVADRLAAAEREESEKGALYRLAFVSDLADAPDAHSIGRKLTTVDGVVAESIEEHGDSNAEQQITEYVLRFRGDARTLRAGLRKLIDQQLGERQDENREIVPLFRSSGRRIEVELRARQRDLVKEPNPDIAIDEIVERAVQRLYAENKEFFGDKPTAVLPVAIGPARNAEAGERPAVSAAIEKRIGASLAAATERTPAIQTENPKLLARQTELHRGEGAIPLQALAALGTKPAAAILASFERVADGIELGVAVVDSSTGETVRNFTTLTGNLAALAGKHLGL